MRYRMQDGTVVDTDRASEQWPARYEWDGSNQINVHTRTQWEDQHLYRSRRGRFWLKHTSAWQGSTPWAEWLSPEQAAAWLSLNGDEIPADLVDAAEQISE